MVQERGRGRGILLAAAPHPETCPLCRCKLVGKGHSWVHPSGSGWGCTGSSAWTARSVRPRWISDISAEKRDRESQSDALGTIQGRWKVCSNVRSFRAKWSYYPQYHQWTPQKFRNGTDGNKRTVPGSRLGVFSSQYWLRSASFMIRMYFLPFLSGLAVPFCMFFLI